MSSHVFIIDDEQDTVMAGTILLKENGYTVSTATDPVDGLNRVKESLPHLVLLDLRMPGMDGFDVCRELKADPHTKNIPILMLSVQADEANIVTGLELGANDFIRKPFRKREFLARVKNLLRQGGTPPSPVPQNIAIGPLKMDLERYKASIKGKPLALEPMEFKLLAFFARNESKVLTRSKLSENVWETPHLPTSRTIDVRVNELRKKMGKGGDWIKSLRGIGYRFEVDEEG